MRMRPDGLFVEQHQNQINCSSWFYLGVHCERGELPAWRPTPDEWAACVDALFPVGQRSKAFIGKMQPNEVLHWPQNKKQTEDSVFATACGLIAPREIDGGGRSVVTSGPGLDARVLELETRLRVLEAKMNKRGSG